MTRFKQALKIVLANEGGYVDHPNDRGGATNQGVTQRTYDAYNKKRGYPLRDVREIHEDEVQDIYYTEYWLAAKCDRVPEGIDLMLFDLAVNSGPQRAIKTLQQAAGVKADGVYGPVTDRAVWRMGDRLHAQFMAQRALFVFDIVARDPSQKVFLKGWLVRLFTVSGTRLA